MPAAYLKSGTDVIGKPAGWGREQIDLLTRTDYHQPSDQYRTAGTSPARSRTRSSASCWAPRWPTPRPLPEWNRGDEFEAARKRALAEAAAAP